jgi:hypothetical protein
MLLELPGISILFIFTTLLTLWFTYKGTHSAGLIISIRLGLLVQTFLALNGFYINSMGIPPRPVALVAPPLLAIIILFNTRTGKKFIDSCDSKWLTYLHVVRIPVEIVLLLLFQQGLIPQLMTFEGRNFDILSGISAPLIAFMGYQKKTLNRKILIAWNIICLILLFNIVINALLSLPTVFQAQAFDQPNTGVLKFPFIYLPCFIVPAVLLSHLICLRKLLK